MIVQIATNPELKRQMLSALDGVPKRLAIDLATHCAVLIIGGMVGWISRGRFD